MVGPNELIGRAAVMGGLSLVASGLAIVAGATAFTRFGSATTRRKTVCFALAAVLLAVDLTLSNRAIALGGHG
jgi:hypothetical protein